MSAQHEIELPINALHSTLAELAAVKAERDEARERNTVLEREVKEWRNALKIRY